MRGQMSRKMSRNGFSRLPTKSCDETSQVGLKSWSLSDWWKCWVIIILKTIKSKGDSAQLKNSMLKLINDRQVMHRSELELLEKIFNFQFESKELIHAVKELDLSWATFRTVHFVQLVQTKNDSWIQEQLLLGNFQWSAKLKITIVEAIGLLPKDNNGSSDPYCLVQGKDHALIIYGSTSSKVGN